MAGQGRPVLHWWDSSPGDPGTSLAHLVKADPTWALGRGRRTQVGGTFQLMSWKIGLGQDIQSQSSVNDLLELKPNDNEFNHNCIIPFS